jgi:hypothetical protein
MAEESQVECLRVTNKGIVEMRLSNEKSQPVYGLAFWFTCCLLASSGRNRQSGRLEYNGPSGFGIRLQTLYFARDAVLPINWQAGRVQLRPGLTSTGITERWFRHDCIWITRLLSAENIGSLPSQWTEDSQGRRNPRLSRRLDMSISDEFYARSGEFRRARQHVLAWAKEQSASGILTPKEYETVCIPLQAFEVSSAVWAEVAAGVEPDDLSPLNRERVPTGKEICVAACLNLRLADRIAGLLMGWCKWFEADDNFPIYSDLGKVDKIVFMCALIVLESIADGRHYLAAFSDVEEATKKWTLVYLC